MEAETNPVTADAGLPEAQQTAPEVSNEPEYQPEPEFDEAGNPIADAEDDSEELEHDGKKYRIPKAIKPLVLMQADYTRKTQEVAETRKALEARETEIRQQAETQQAYIDDLADLRALDKSLEQWKSVNWQQIEAEDPLRAQSLWRQYQQLKESRQSMVGQLSEKYRQRSEEAQRDRAKRLQEAQATLAREIKDWSPQKARELTEFGAKHGLSESEIAELNFQPRLVKLLDLARMGEQLVSKQIAAAKAAPQQPEAKPVPTVGGTSRTAKDPRRMSMEEYARWRAAGNG